MTTTYGGDNDCHWDSKEKNADINWDFLAAADDEGRRERESILATILIGLENLIFIYEFYKVRFPKMV